MPDDATPNGAPLPLERRLATILCADVAGYSHMMGVDEERTVEVFRGHRAIYESLVKLHRGRIFNTAGDALLAEFNSAVEAVRCATEIQAALRTRNEHLAPEERMLFRMGINLGDVIVQGDDLLGDGVNVAARIQTSTQPGGICISGSVYDQIQNKLSLDFKPLGEQVYKNIARPVRTYTITEGAAVTLPASRRSSKVTAVIAAVLLVIVGAGAWSYRQYEARRAEQVRVESDLAGQLAAQKQATEQALRAAEEARRDAQLRAQTRTAEDTLRRAQEERDRLEQDRKRLETEKRAVDAAQRQAAEDTLRRAQEERDRLEHDRKRLGGQPARRAVRRHLHWTALQPSQRRCEADVLAGRAGRPERNGRRELDQLLAEHVTRNRDRRGRRRIGADIGGLDSRRQSVARGPGRSRRRRRDHGVGPVARRPRHYGKLEARAIERGRGDRAKERRFVRRGLQRTALQPSEERRETELLAGRVGRPERDRRRELAQPDAEDLNGKRDRGRQWRTGVEADGLDP